MTRDAPQSFAAYVLKARGARVLSREQVARHVGIAAAEVRRWEMGDVPPSDPEVLVRLAGILRVPVAHLVDRVVAERAFVRVACDTEETKKLCAALLMFLGADGRDVAALADVVASETP